ncbi:MAG: HEAT repeat domain-containing protein, partial [Lentisphaerota bacterium]
LRVRYRAAQSMGQMASTQAVGVLITALSDVSPVVQEASVVSLGKIQDPMLADRLLALTNQASPDLTWHMVKLLGQTHDPRSLDFLVSALQSSDPGLRDEAADALGKIGDPRAIDPLIAALKDSDVFVRSSSAGALEHMKDRKAIDPLIAAMDDNHMMRMSVVASLQTLTGKKLGDQSDEWRSWWDSVKDSKETKLPFEEPVQALDAGSTEDTSPWPSLTVAGVMVGKEGKTGAAVINSRIIHEREAVDGVTLEKVMENSVQLKYRKQTRVLKVNESIKGPAAGSKSP